MGSWTNSVVIVRSVTHATGSRVKRVAASVNARRRWPGVRRLAGTAAAGHSLATVAASNVRPMILRLYDPPEEGKEASHFRYLRQLCILRRSRRWRRRNADARAG